MAKYIYSLWKNNKLVGTYTADKIAEKIGCSPITVRNRACDGKAFQGIYKISMVRDKKASYVLEALLIDWDSIRQRLLHSGYDLGRIQIVRAEEA